MASDAPSTSADGLLSRLVNVERGEAAALVTSFVHFFAVLCAYYIIRPVRDEMGVAIGQDGLKNLFVVVFLVMLAAVNFLLSWRLKPIDPQAGLPIDWVGALLSSSAIIFLSFGFSGLNSWGFILATPAAPFSVLGLSPALIFIVIGSVLAQSFFSWLRRRSAEQKPHLCPWRLSIQPPRRLRRCVWRRCFSSGQPPTS